MSTITNEIMELIPDTNQPNNRAIKPMTTHQSINSRRAQLKRMMKVEVAVKILLGAQTKATEIHPIEYCYRCLNIKLHNLDCESVES